MINVTVIKGKDALKYLVRIILGTILIFILARYFYGLKKTNTIVKGENTYKKENVNLNLISCLEETIPQAKQVKAEENEKKQKENTIKPVKTVLSTQLGFLEDMEEEQSVILDKLSYNENIYTDIEKENEIQNNQNSSQSEQEIKLADTNVKTEVIENNVPNKYTNSYNGVQIKNESELNINEQQLNENLEFNKNNVVIFHTHTCESYTSSEKYSYEHNGSFRTTDLNFSVARVGDELETQLKSYGFNVIHDKTYHDYPAYSGSYARSLTTVQNIMMSNPNTDIIIDLHRDVIADSTYAPKVKIGDEYASQLMFVIGTNGTGLEHPNWIENLKFAIMVQKKANEMYPGLFKPIILRDSRYNQHLGKCACIIEVGATGNTLDESNNSMKYLGKVLSDL